MPMVICYPLMKRYTNFPQLVLGMTFNWYKLKQQILFTKFENFIWIMSTNKPTLLVFLLCLYAGVRWWVGHLWPERHHCITHFLCICQVISTNVFFKVFFCIIQWLLWTCYLGVCWTLIYDTLYGYQDRKDDVKLELKSTSLFLGERPQIPLSILCGAMMAGLVTTGYTNDLSFPYYVLVLLLWFIFIHLFILASVMEGK